MASIKCAHCKGTHISVQEVRLCAMQNVPALAVVGQSRNGVASEHENFSFSAMVRLEQEVMEQRLARRTQIDSGDYTPAPRPDYQSTAVTHRSLMGPDWEMVRHLRDELAALLVRTERGKKIGYFALLDGTTDIVKFYRVRTGRAGGKWAYNLFLDAQASDEFWPVRDYHTTRNVLDGILADPAAAALLYATELGRCCRCNRTLTDETSRALGIGPDCRNR